MSSKNGDHIEPKSIIHIKVKHWKRIEHKSGASSALGFLVFGREKELMPIMIFRDSYAIVDWEKGIHSLHTIEIHHWIILTKDLLNNFQQTASRHIFWELNTEAYSLSKQAIGVGMESIDWILVQEGT